MYQSKGEDTIKILCIQKSEGTLISSDFFDRIDTREDYMMRKVLFFDIDGTLAIHGHIPESNKKALEALKEKGYDTFVCTGRAPYYAENLFGKLVSGIISCNGRYISYKSEKLYGVPFTQDEVDILKHKLDNLECGGLFVSDTFSTPYHLEGDVLTHVKKEYGEEHIKDEEGTYYTCDFFYDTLEKRDAMIEAFKDDRIINDHGGSGSCDTSTLVFDKGHAIKYIIEHFSLTKEDAYAFGDGYNDQAMFREVGQRIAMGNGVDVLKEKATYITDTVDNEGIYKALKHYELL